MIDVSTLGKIEISGPDAVDFLQFMLPAKYAKFEVGKTRYSIMVGEDGILFEDGFSGGYWWKILMCRSKISA